MAHLFPLLVVLLAALAGAVGNSAPHAVKAYRPDDLLTWHLHEDPHRSPQPRRILDRIPWGTPPDDPKRPRWTPHAESEMHAAYRDYLGSREGHSPRAGNGRHHSRTEFEQTYKRVIAQQRPSTHPPPPAAHRRARATALSLIKAEDILRGVWLRRAEVLGRPARHPVDAGWMFPEFRERGRAVFVALARLPAAGWEGREAARLARPWGATRDQRHLLEAALRGRVRQLRSEAGAARA